MKARERGEWGPVRTRNAVRESGAGIRSSASV